MDEVIVVNCGTGTALRRDMNPDEQAQRRADTLEHAARQKAQQDEDTAREGVLTQAAQKLGVSVDDLKLAFRTGRRTGPPDPRRQQLLQERRAAQGQTG